MKWPRWNKPVTPAAGAQLMVPDGHEVQLHHVKGLAPEVMQAPGGAWLANVGSSSDEQPEELKRLLTQVHELTRGVRPQVLLAVSGGALSSLFAPADVMVQPLRGWLIWTLDAPALVHAPEAPVLLQHLLRCMYRISRMPIGQSVFLSCHDTTTTPVIEALFHELGLGVRRAEPDLAVLLEVRRPEGVVLSSLLGTPVRGDAVGPGWAFEINAKKDRATNSPERESIVAEERRMLTARLERVRNLQREKGVDRAPRLRRLALAAVERRDALALQQLLQELQVREQPLLFVADPKTANGELRLMPDGLRALPVYGDRASLFASASRQALLEGSRSWVEMRASHLRKSAAEQGTTVALCAVDDEGREVHVALPVPAPKPGA